MQNRKKEGERKNKEVKDNGRNASDLVEKAAVSQSVDGWAEFLVMRMQCSGTKAGLS